MGASNFFANLQYPLMWWCGTLWSNDTRLLFTALPRECAAHLCNNVAFCCCGVFFFASLVHLCCVRSIPHYLGVCMLVNINCPNGWRTCELWDHTPCATRARFSTLPSVQSDLTVC